MRSKLINIFIYSFILLAFFVKVSFNTQAQSGMGENTENNLNNKIEIFEIAENRVFCEELVPKKCLQVKREGGEEFEPLWDEIENFAFIQGYKYLLKVEVEKIERPPKDTSGYKYYLKEIISREKVENPDNMADLYLSKWFLTRINGKKIENGKPFIVFEKSKGSFYGNTGCNSFGGQFKIDGKSVEFSGLRQTKRACPNMQSVEFPFTQNLGVVNKLEVEQDRLYLNKGGVVVLEFESNWER